ncbi:hypothetical protein ACWFRB_16275 [Rhodococcus sp. NPDC055112]
MFEELDSWDELWPQTPTLRRFEPPRPVIFYADRALPLARNQRRADRIALRVRAGGLRIEGKMRAYQHAWAQLASLHQSIRTEFVPWGDRGFRPVLSISGSRAASPVSGAGYRATDPVVFSVS